MAISQGKIDKVVRTLFDSSRNAAKDIHSTFNVNLGKSVDGTEDWDENFLKIAPLDLVIPYVYMLFLEVQQEKKYTKRQLTELLMHFIESSAYYVVKYKGSPEWIARGIVQERLDSVEGQIFCEDNTREGYFNIYSDWFLTEIWTLDNVDVSGLTAILLKHYEKSNPEKLRSSI